MESRKTEDGRLEVTETKTVTNKNTYDIDFLIKQRASIQAQKDEQMAQRDKELAEIDSLLGECAKHGIEVKEDKIQ